jgi:cytochrome b6-f complex iron-sulfur subunit
VSGRPVRRFVDGLLRGQRTERARPDDVEAGEMKTAIELRAARTGSDSPREEFITDLHRRLAEQMGDAPAQAEGSSWGPSGTRRQVVIGTGLAAASAAAGIVVGRNLLAPSREPAEEAAPTQGVLEPNAGTWHAVGASADLPKGGALAFDLGSVNGFVHRGDAKIEAVSGVCTHQGCKLWLDAPDARLRCPCHSTSFSLTGETLTHQLPTAPPPLPRVEVRENNGQIEVFTPTEPA